MAIYTFMKYVDEFAPDWDLALDEDCVRTYYAAPESEFWYMFGAGSFSDIKLRLKYLNYASVLLALCIPLAVGAFTELSVLLAVPMVVMSIATSLVAVYYLFRKESRTVLYDGFDSWSFKRLLSQLADSDKACFITDKDSVDSENRRYSHKVSCWLALEDALKVAASKDSIDEELAVKEFRHMLEYGAVNHKLKAMIDRYVIHAMELQLSYKEALEDAHYVMDEAFLVVASKISSDTDRREQVKIDKQFRRDSFRAGISPQRYLMDSLATREEEEGT